MSAHRFPGGVISATPTSPNASGAPGIWTVEEALRNKQAGLWPDGSGMDTNFSGNVMLLHADGTNGAQNNTFLDESSNNFTITRTGNPTQGSFSPFYGPGNWSCYFDGTGDYLTVAANTSHGTIAGDFTVEGWFYFNTVATAQQLIFTHRSSTNLYAPFLLWATTSTITLYMSSNNSSWNLVNAVSVATGMQANKWYHLALTRSGNNIYFFVNGVQTYTASIASATFANTGTFNVGMDPGETNTALNGYVSNVRMVNGSALYTTNFTPSTQPLTVTSNTVLLVCAGPNLFDRGPGNLLVTRNGDTTVSKFSPFSLYQRQPTYYSGGFDGTGDYVSVTDVPALELSAADFTIECWVFFNSASQCAILSKRAASTGYGPIVVFKDSSNVLRLYAATGTASWDIINGISFGTANIGQWNHISVCRAGSVFYGSLNGVVTILGTSNLTIADVATNWMIGADSDTNGVNGSISNLRIVKGTARYTSNFTPATAPLAVTESASSATRSYSLSLDSNGDYLTFAGSPAYNLSSGAWTIEGWIYAATLKNATIISQGEAVWRVALGSTGAMQFVFNTSSVMNFGTITAGTWNHFAITCDGTGSASGVKAYLNGVLGSSGQLVPPNDSTSTMYVGSNPAALSTWGFNGQISNLRLTRGQAIYTSTSSFTPPTAPLADLTVTGNSSAYFDGTGDYLSLPTKTGGYLTSGNDFTVEGWVYLTGYPQVSVSSYASAMAATSGSSNGWEFVITGSTGSNVTGVSFSMKGVASATYTGALNLNQWYHLAAVRSGGTLKVYVNGVAGATTATLNTWTDNTTLWIGACTAPSYPFYLNGYLSNFRITNGQALYTTAFTPTTSPLTTTSQGATASNVALLTCQDYGLTDRSTNANTIYPNGDAKSSALNPFGVATAMLLGQAPIIIDNSVNHATPTINGEARTTNHNPFVTQNAVDQYSLAFDGSGDYIGSTGATALQFGTGDFSIEFWFYPNASFSGSVDTVFLESGTTLPAFNLWWSWIDVGFFVTTGASTRMASTYKVGQWQHIAVCRQNGRISTFVNGVRTASVASTYNFSSAGTWIGGRNGGTVPFNGYISDLRIVKGSSAYPVAASGIPLPTAPLSPITNTALLIGQDSTIIDESGNNVVLAANGDARAGAFSAYGGGTNLLTLQSSTFVDNSGASRAITATGNAQPKAASPFTQVVSLSPVQYTPSAYGGSMFFDGTGDYLGTPSSPNLAFGTGDFTMEGYFYFIARTQSYPQVFSNSTSGSLAANIWGFYYDRSDSAGAFRLYVGNVNTVTQLISVASPYSLYNRWSHIAFVRRSGTYYIFVDGAQIFSGANAVSIDSGTSEAFYVSMSGVGALNAHVSNVRVVKGSALYSGPFVPPAAPVTAVTNTQLLLNGTNAGIYDSAGVNNIETAGSAQISTSAQKFGTGSISFPSSGSFLTMKGANGAFNGLNVAGSSLLYAGATFTIEAWINPSAKVTTAGYYSNILGDVNTTSGTYMCWCVGLNSAGLACLAWYDGALKLALGTTTIPNNAWTHLAFVANAGVVTVYVNGVNETTGTTTLTTPTQTTGFLSSGVDRANYWTGNLDDLRVTKGVARYTGNFTPPAAPYANF